MKVNGQKLVVLAWFCLLIGCGDGVDYGRADPPISSVLDGTWNGVATIVFNGLPPGSYNGSVELHPDGHILTAGGICSDGSGVISASGSGISATWSGSIDCPPVDVFADCHSVAMRYTSGTVVYQSDGSIAATLTGSGSGCGTVRAGTTSFNGRQ